MPKKKKTRKIHKKISEGRAYIQSVSIIRSLPLRICKAMLSLGGVLVLPDLKVLGKVPLMLLN